jgi:hypothetical protein
MEFRLACVVKGHGDREAAPILVRRIVDRVHSSVRAHILHPIRIPRSRLVKPGELERAVQLAALHLEGWGAVLVLLDADDDCPAQLGPELLHRATQICSHVPLSVVLAKREFEAWFLASAESLRGYQGLPPDLGPPADPEGVRDAKGWLGDRMAERKYVETLDQPSLARRFDIDLARRSDSFDKCYREVVRLLALWRSAAES